MSPASTYPDLSLPSLLASQFAPLHKRALGAAAGLTLGAVVALITLFHLVVHPEHAPDIGLLAQFFYGYSVSWRGVVVGALWGLILGFVAGYVGAGIRNLTLRVWLLVIRTRAMLAQPYMDEF